MVTGVAALCPVCGTAMRTCTPGVPCSTRCENVQLKQGIEWRDKRIAEQEAQLGAKDGVQRLRDRLAGMVDEMEKMLNALPEGRPIGNGVCPYCSSRIAKGELIIENDGLYHCNHCRGER